MIRSITILVLLLCALRPAIADDPAKATEFSKTVAGEKDVAALAELLQKQLHSPAELLLQIKDAESLATAKTSFQQLSSRIDVISKRLQQLPVPSTADREAISKKMEERDAANMKKQQPAMQAHMKAMPADLKAQAMQEMKAFYQGLDAHGKVFEKYFRPDKQPSSEEPKKGASPKPEKP